MPTIALVVLLAAGVGLALLIRSIVSLETAIDRDNEVPAKDYPDRGRAQEAINVLEANGIPSMIRHVAIAVAFTQLSYVPSKLTRRGKFFPRRRRNQSLRRSRAARFVRPP
jgi:hypothetical protein